jgi:hypothetical protein
MVFRGLLTCAVVIYPSPSVSGTSVKRQRKVVQFTFGMPGPPLSAQPDIWTHALIEMQNARVAVESGVALDPDSMADIPLLEVLVSTRCYLIERCSPKHQCSCHLLTMLHIVDSKCFTTLSTFSSHGMCASRHWYANMIYPHVDA